MPVAGIAFGMVVAVIVVGVGGWLPGKGKNGSQNGPDEQSLAPFYQAVANLAAAPSIGYKTSKTSPGQAPGQADVRVLRDGTAVGNYEKTVDYDVLTVDNKTYFKPAQGLLYPRGDKLSPLDPEGEERVTG